MEDTMNKLMKTMGKYESEISSILGMLVVAALAVFIFLVVKKFMPKPAITPLAENTSVAEDLMKKEEERKGQYTVKSGQGLSQIAKEVYGDAGKWAEIAKANNLKAPYVLSAGQTLVLPEGAQAVTPTAQPEAAKPTLVEATSVPVAKATPEAKPTEMSSADKGGVQGGGTYEVQKGDHLWKIAVAKYGNGYDWVKIYRANKKLIGSNPGKIYAGTTLVIPE